MSAVTPEASTEVPVMETAYQSPHLKWLEKPLAGIYLYQWVAIHAEKGIIAYGPDLAKLTKVAETLSTDELLFHFVTVDNVTPEDVAHHYETRSMKRRMSAACVVLIVGGGLLMSGILPEGTEIFALAGSLMAATLLVWWKNSLPWGS